MAADTSDVKAATDPRREQNFCWHNMGLTNQASVDTEYPVEFLYREVLGPDALMEALSFFLVRVPQRDAQDDRPERPALRCFRVTTRAELCARWPTAFQSTLPRVATLATST